MFRQLGNRRRRAGSSHGAPIEMLESRVLLSAVPSAQVHPGIVIHRSAGTGPGGGYTPAQIRHAYGVDQIKFNNGTVTGDGSGQTIAIVDAYDAPNIVSDLATFDTQFGLAAPPSFTVVNQTGGTSLPDPDIDWAAEISLDVEWAHAIAPKANILLVEANSASPDDLDAAVNYARTVPGVSAVSMSFGGSEFFPFNGQENVSLLATDAIFTTPAGHQGVTFVAASGDAGVGGGVSYPATSPNVLGVGGTTLTADTSGTYGSEQAWSGSGGGYSQLEAEPPYQELAQTNNVRTSPDVAWNADINTGFSVYDSYGDVFSGSPWEAVGGTSAGSPQWAALIAIINQGRVLNGLSTLDGPTQTLPALYSFYALPGTAGYSTYTSYFNDVSNNGGLAGWQWMWGFGYINGQATPGYDIVTGLGTPKADKIAATLSTMTTFPATAPAGSAPGQGGGGTVNPDLVGSPLTGSFLPTKSGAILDGDKGVIRLRIQNTSLTSFNGPAQVVLYASTHATINTESFPIATIPLGSLSLKSGQAKVVKLRFNYPATIPTNTYYYVASITTSNSKALPGVAIDPIPVTIGPGSADLGLSGEAVQIKPGKHMTAAFDVINHGNVTAKGALTLKVYESADQVFDASDTLLATVSVAHTSIRAGHSKTLRVRFLGPTGHAPGTYTLVAALTPATQPADTNAADNTIIVGTWG